MGGSAGRIPALELAGSFVSVAALAVSAFWAYRSTHNASAPPTAQNVTELIGSTPIVRLNEISRITGCEVYAKLELANPGGSAKDRIALAIVEHAEETGQLRAGYRDCVFEGTSGSTGISLALVCRAKGYEAHIVVPDDTSRDKVNLLKRLGAFVHEVRPASIADAGHYVNVARRLAKETVAQGERRAIFANQFEDQENWRAHFRTTGPEIVQQMRRLGLPIDCFVSGAGTGGTIAGVGRYLKEHCHLRTKVVLADVPGSGLFNKVHYGVMFNATEREGKRRRHQVDTVVEGIGLNRITENFAAGHAFIDDAVRVEDIDSRYMAAHLVEHEGLFVGSSSAVNCVATLRQAVELGPGHSLLTVLCDSGTRHLSKFYKEDPSPDCAVAKEIRQLESKINK